MRPNPSWVTASRGRGAPLHRAEDVDRRPLVEVAEHHRHLALGLDGGERRLELGPGLRRLHAGGRELLGVVVDADDLTDLRQAVEAALPERLAVRAVRRVLAHRLGVALVPAVGLGVGIQRAQLSGLDERAHVGAAVVGLDDVGRLGAAQRQPQRRLQVVERAGDPLDRDVGVLRLELLVELAHLRRLPAADLLVPHRQRDLARLGHVGADRGSRGGGRGRGGAARARRARGRGRQADAAEDHQQSRSTRGHRVLQGRGRPTDRTVRRGRGGPVHGITSTSA